MKKREKKHTHTTKKKFGIMRISCLKAILNYKWNVFASIFGVYLSLVLIHIRRRKIVTMAKCQASQCAKECFFIIICYQFRFHLRLLFCSPSFLSAKNFFRLALISFETIMKSRNTIQSNLSAFVVHFQFVPGPSHELNDIKIHIRIFRNILWIVDATIFYFGKMKMTFY